MNLNKKVVKAVFPVGGLGTRFLPATKSLPKEMLPVANKPLIQHAFEEAKEAGIEQFFFITGRNKNAISNHFDYSYELQSILSDNDKNIELSLTKDWLPPAGHIAFIRQREALGLGHAIWCARNFIKDEPFAVILADEMLSSKENFLKSMCELYQEKNTNIIGIAEIEKSKSDKYGIVEPLNQDNDVIQIISMVEKPDPQLAPSNLSIIGRYILTPQIFQAIEDTVKGRNNEYQLTDAMALLLRSQKFYGLKFQGKRFDCGDQVGFLNANIEYAIQNEKIADQIIAMLAQYKNII